MGRRNESFDREEDHSFSSYSQLLDSTCPDMEQSFMYSTFHSSPKPPTMLCFGNANNSSSNTSISIGINNKKKKKKKLDEELGFVERGNKVIQKPGIAGGGDSSPASSSNNSSSSSSNSFTKSKRGRIGNLKQTEQEERDNGCGSNKNPTPVSGLGSSNSQTTKRTKTTTTSNKKLKRDTPPSVAAPIKVRKEKIGERITALQQLVSPFGKTDTASVLHEAMGYIRFLHDQVQVLSSPYLQKLPTSGPFAVGGRRAAAVTGVADLRSRGLCLVPSEYILDVANCNGADLWSPAAAMGNILTKNAN